MEPIEFKDIKYVLAVENAGSFSRTDRISDIVKAGAAGGSCLAGS